MTKTQKLTDIILNYQLLNNEYEWYKSHEYVFRELAVQNYSVLDSYSTSQKSCIKSIYTKWVGAMELAEKIDQELKYNRSTKSY